MVTACRTRPQAAELRGCWTTGSQSQDRDAGLWKSVEWTWTLSSSVFFHDNWKYTNTVSNGFKCSFCIYPLWPVSLVVSQWINSRGWVSCSCGTRLKTGWRCNVTTERNAPKHVPSSMYSFIHNVKTNTNTTMNEENQSTPLCRQALDGRISGEMSWWRLRLPRLKWN